MSDRHLLGLGTCLILLALAALSLLCLVFVLLLVELVLPQVTDRE